MIRLFLSCHRGSRSFGASISLERLLSGTQCSTSNYISSLQLEAPGRLVPKLTTRFSSTSSSSSSRETSSGLVVLSKSYRDQMNESDSWNQLTDDPSHATSRPEPPISPSISPVSSSDITRGVSEVSGVSQVIFDSCWRRFEERYRLRNVFVPREVVWLNGAPGAGKGVNTSHIMQTRGLEYSISLSDLLKCHPDSGEFINRGTIMPDTVVGDLLLEALLINTCKSPECGVLVDGFPRTAQQVDFLKLLNDKLSDLHATWANTQHEQQFPRPLFKVVMLYVDEETSIARQMARAQVASLHNKRVMDAGAGDLVEQRVTDTSIDTCKKRYSIFRQHYTATLRLKQFFPFHLIDAMGSLAETQEAITTELRYQSSLDLSFETYQAIRHLPLAKDLVQLARQKLVHRLNAHSEKHPHLFQRVIDVITAEIMPLLRESGMSGSVEYISELRLLNDHQQAAQILIDVLTDRGFKASHSAEVSHVPVSVDLTTGLIKTRKDIKHRFSISWDSQSVRDLHALELASRMAESSAAAKDIRISQSFIPPPQPNFPSSGSKSGMGRGTPDEETDPKDSMGLIFGS